MAYEVIALTDNLRFESSRLGDVVMTNVHTGTNIYFQPGDAGSEVLSILEEEPPASALDIHFMHYYPGIAE